MNEKFIKALKQEIMVTQARMMAKGKKNGDFKIFFKKFNK